MGAMTPRNPATGAAARYGERIPARVVGANVAIMFIIGDLLP